MTETFSTFFADETAFISVDHHVVVLGVLPGKFLTTIIALEWLNPWNTKNSSHTVIVVKNINVTHYVKFTQFNLQDFLKFKIS